MKCFARAVVVASVLLVAQLASGQPMGVSTGMMPGGSASMIAGMEGWTRPLTVAADGSLYLLRPSESTPAATELVAIRPTGTIAWSSALPGAMPRIDVAGPLVLATIVRGEPTLRPGSGFEGSRLVALSAFSGAVQWETDLDGFVTAIEPFSGGIYLLVVRSEAPLGMGLSLRPVMRQSITALDDGGRILWSLALN